ncbi:MAG: amino acid adenylation domain-containing protein [Proteobacteria bacterium]|nr:amino acid adenylation domain-containing protein [Pseudomonadota bacterium]
MGILLPRSMEAIVAILGALRAGVTFLPIDPQYPEERIRYLIEDSHAEIVMALQSTVGSLPDSASNIILLDTLPRGEETATFDTVPPESIAYIIYTSGSTGNPKGVCVPRSAISNNCEAIRNLAQLVATDRALQFMSLSFDAVFEEIFPTLCAGATLVLRNDSAIVSTDEFFKTVEQKHISILNLPTAFWHTIVHNIGSNTWPASLRFLIIGGERAFDTTHGRFREQETSHIQLINSYGPTETTVTSTIFDDCEVDEEAAFPIGRPISSVSHFVLDDLMSPVPCGEVGQLYIGGAGLARGYLGRPELTAAAFVDHPFNKGARLYATGDLVFVTEQGNFVYVNRADSQVKIRGFRIEPGEIETHLVSLPHVIEAAVVPETRDEKDVILVAHIVLDADAPEVNELRNQLSKRVPAYLVPAVFRIHAELPKTASGKVDRRSLVKSFQRDDGPAETRTPIHSQSSRRFENDIRKIWTELLECTEIAEDSNFFECGGDSLRLVQLFAEIEHRTQQKPNPAAFLRRPTFGNMVQLVEDEYNNDETQFLVQMNRGDSTLRPLFMAPGVCGVATDYIHLISSLDPSIPIYGLQIDHVDDHSKTALHEYAARSVEHMKRVQKKGPYAVAGFSAGGIISLEIAQVLLANGDEVDFMGILDGTPPYSVKRPWPLSSPTRLIRFTKSVVNKSVDWSEAPTYDLGWLTQQAKRIVSRGYAKWTQKNSETDEIGDLLNLANGQIPDHIVAKWQRTLSAVNAYQHRKLPVDIILFRTQFDPVEGPHEHDLSWGRIGSKRVIVNQLPGTHDEVLTKKTSPTLAKLMEPYLLNRR